LEGVVHEGGKDKLKDEEGEAKVLEGTSFVAPD